MANPTVDKIKAKLKDLADKGILLPVLQDPITKLPSITYTFFVGSGLVCLAASFESVKFFAGINFDEIKQFFDMCSYVYVGRSAIKAMAGVGDNNGKEKL